MTSTPVPAGSDPKIKDIITSLDDEKIGKNSTYNTSTYYIHLLRKDDPRVVNILIFFIVWSAFLTLVFI